MVSTKVPIHNKLTLNHYNCATLRYTGVYNRLYNDQNKLSLSDLLHRTSCRNMRHGWQHKAISPNC